MTELYGWHLFIEDMGHAIITQDNSSDNSSES